MVREKLCSLVEKVPLISPATGRRCSKFGKLRKIRVRRASLILSTRLQLYHLDLLPNQPANILAPAAQSRRCTRGSVVLIDQDTDRRRSIWPTPPARVQRNAMLCWDQLVRITDRLAALEALLHAFSG